MMSSPQQKSSLAWVAIAVFIMALLFLSHIARPFVYLSGDVDIYQSIGEDAWRADDLLKSEYPPVTTALFALLKPPAMNMDFPEIWIAFLTVACLAATAWTAWTCNLRESCVVLFSALATMLLLGLDVTWGRYDLLIGILLLLTWLAHRRGRFAAAGFFLMMAAGLKLVPVVLLPLLYLATPTPSRRMLTRGTIAGALIALVLPLVVIGPVGTTENVLYMVLYHAERGVQLESTWSGLTILWEVVHGHKATILFAFRSHENVEVPSILSLLGMVLGILGLIGIFWKRKKLQGNLAPMMLCAFAWLLFLSPVLSPQYMSWLLPLLLTWCILEWRRAHRSGLVAAIFCTGCAAAILTNVIYLPLYLNLVDQQDLLPTLVLNLRNAMILVLALLILKTQNKTPTIQKQQTSSLPRGES